MNETVTMTLDAELLGRARELAGRQGVSLDALVGRCLEQAVAKPSSASAVRELIELFETSGGYSGGRRIGRDEAYTD